MVLSCRSVRVVLTITAALLAAFPYSVSAFSISAAETVRDVGEASLFSTDAKSHNPVLYLEGLYAPDLIASTVHNRGIVLDEPEDFPVSVEMPEESCDQITCMDIYPEDGKIEGRTVSQMIPSGINNLGQVVGRCSLEESSIPFAFVREPDGNVWIFKTPSSSGQGEFTDINDTGAAVGFYQNDRMRTNIGFLMNSRKEWEADIEYPENPCPKDRSYLHTQPNGINDEGEIVGNYGCTAQPEDPAETLFRGDGFYRSPDGTYFRIQYENARRTVAGKISNNGVIVGYYVMDDDVWIPFAAAKEDVLKPVFRSEGRVR